MNFVVPNWVSVWVALTAVVLIGALPAQADEFAMTVPWQGVLRHYEVHVPPAADRDLPVVLAFHGGGATPQKMREITDLDSLADREGFIVVYPAGTNPDVNETRLYWNDGRPPVDPDWGKTDDVGFVDAMLDEISMTFPVDERRIYATGISNGASLAYRLAAELGDRISAIAPVATVRRFDDFEATSDVKVPIIHFHGRLDQFVPFEGDAEPRHGELFHPTPSVAVEDAFSTWVEHNQSEPFPTSQQIRQATRLRYDAQADGVPSELWILNDGGHAWPGRQVPLTLFELAIGLGPISDSISATEQMWSFFQQVPPPIPGDFNRDGLLDASDIDQLSQQVRLGTHRQLFDLNDDTLVNQADRIVWVTVIKRTFMGDANLDGQFNSADLIEVFGRAEYEDGIAGNSTWATGDWNGDGDFTSADLIGAFVSGSYEMGPRGLAVPEPASNFTLLLLAAMGLGRQVIRSRRRGVKDATAADVHPTRGR